MNAETKAAPGTGAAGLSAEVKVLLIEDNGDLLEIVHQFLEAYGFRIIPARDGQEGLDAFARDRPDIVLADVLLPKVNGFQVCERIKKGPRPTPVVLMSALYKTYNLQKEAKTKYGADEYLIKPLNLVAVAKLLCGLLGIERPTPGATPLPGAPIAEPSPAAPAAPAAAAPVDAFDVPIEVEEAEPAPAPPPTPAQKAPPPEPPAPAVKAPPPAAASPKPKTPAAPAAKTASFAPAGRLADAPIEQVLAHFYLAGVTGKLTVTAPPFTRLIFIKNGVPLYVQSNSPAETFTHLLVADGKITANQLARAERMARDRKTTVGKTMADSGLIDADELAPYLLHEVNCRLIATLALTAGEYSFVADTSWTAKIKRPEMELFDLTYKAIVQKDDAAALQRRYATAQNKVVVKNEERLPLVGRIQWRDEHLDAFMFIDGERTIGELTEQSGQPPSIVHQLLYTLELFDMVRFR
jgi:CheY-like chemotaxis protein